MTATIARASTRRRASCRSEAFRSGARHAACYARDRWSVPGASGAPGAGRRRSREALRGASSSSSSSSSSFKNPSSPPVGRVGNASALSKRRWAGWTTPGPDAPSAGRGRSGVVHAVHGRGTVHSQSLSHRPLPVWVARAGRGAQRPAPGSRRHGHGCTIVRFLLDRCCVSLGATLPPFRGGRRLRSRFSRSNALRAVLPPAAGRPARGRALAARGLENAGATLSV
jgi:hypothetical protein